ncbi:hypothetical protein BEH94_11220 [Candidatus Altiarchaeales archaeon WOR_SM1_SCG]|nr:hypothetical protein BEH94_11220 [Candidatus Altiarchaeales archaeon WOR_SM1_SCG]
MMNHRSHQTIVGMVNAVAVKVAHHVQQIVGNVQNQSHQTIVEMADVAVVKVAHRVQKIVVNAQSQNVKPILVGIWTTEEKFLELIMST